MTVSRPGMSPTPPRNALVATALPYKVFAWLLLLVPAADSQDPVLRQDQVVDAAALNFSSDAASFAQNINGRTFQRHPMATHKGYQYTAYYDGERRVCLGRRQLPRGAWEVIRFPDYRIEGNDTHNTVVVGVCPADGTIHLAFDHHADPLHYRVSAAGVASDPSAVAWRTDLFGPVSDRLGEVEVGSRLTYPTFVPAPNGNLLFYYRDGGSGNGNGMLQEYDGTRSRWSTGMGRIISGAGRYTGDLSAGSTSRNPYLNGISFAGSRLHLTWGWRESSATANSNHDLNYAYSDDYGRTWFNSAGARAGTVGTSPMSIDTPGLVVAAIPENSGLSNQYTHHPFPDGSCHVMLHHHAEGTRTRRYHHHWRDVQGSWHRSALPFSGSRPKLVGDMDGTLYLAFTSGGRLRIARGRPDPARMMWDWSVIHIQSDVQEAGEGHIDTARFAHDGVLSIYG